MNNFQKRKKIMDNDTRIEVFNIKKMIESLTKKVDELIKVRPHRDSEEVKPQFPKDGWRIEVKTKGKAHPNIPEWTEIKHEGFAVKTGAYKNTKIRLLPNIRYEWTGSVPPIKEGIKWVAFHQDSNSLSMYTGDLHIYKNGNWNLYNSFMLLEPMEIEL
jgi:hypothetical protein